MIHKVEITNNIGSGMDVTQHFEAVIDTPEEAETFGEEAAHFFLSFMNGWAEGSDE